MREILFRGKRIDNGEWIYGDLSQIKALGKHSCYISTQLVNPKTVGQFIQEVNKQRIFENDIVKAYKHGDLEDQPFIHPIECRNGTYWFGNWTWLEFLNVMRFVEVIGNIRDKEAK